METFEGRVKASMKYWSSKIKCFGLVQLPLHQLCYDLSPLSGRVTGDLCAS